MITNKRLNIDSMPDEHDIRLTAKQACQINKSGVFSDSEAVREIKGYLGSQQSKGLYAVLRQIEIPSSLFYISIAALNNSKISSILAQYFPNPLVDFIIQHLRTLLNYLQPSQKSAIHGFELWTTIAKSNAHRDCYLHIDNDEQLRTSTGEIRTPMLGSVLYVGPARGLIGGDTLFIQDDRTAVTVDVFKTHDWQELKKLGQAARVTRHAAGKLVLFAGHLPHGQGPVLKFAEDSPRIAFLVNLWTSRIGDVPHGICCLSPEAFTLRTTMHDDN